MDRLQSAEVQCPYCGEEIEVLVDCSIEVQEYIEDCSVCCRPIVLKVEASTEGLAGVRVSTEDD